MKEVILTFLKGAGITFFVLYTAFILYGIHKLGIETMMPLVKLEMAFILFIVLLVIRHILTQYENKLMSFAHQKQNF